VSRKVFDYYHFVIDAASPAHSGYGLYQASVSEHVRDGGQGAGLAGRAERNRA
jgi:hypothetical protein